MRDLNIQPLPDLWRSSADLLGVQGNADHLASPISCCQHQDRWARKEVDPYQVMQEQQASRVAALLLSSRESEMRTQENQELACSQRNPQSGSCLSAALHGLSGHAWMRSQNVLPDGWKVRSLTFFGVARVDKSHDGIFH